jgi:hypothetical protein
MATRSEWIERVKRCDESGLDAAEFARRHGLKVKQFYEWRRELRRPERVPSAAPRLPPVRGGFPSPGPGLTAPSAPQWVDIALPHGDLVRVLPGVDPATLAYILAVVAELSR